MGKMLHLEGLRGLAAFMVFLIHLLPNYWNDLLNLLGQSQNPWVALFYILSGRVLTVSILKRNDSKGLGISILKRPFRLGIPLVASTVINVIVKRFTQGAKFTLLQTFMVPIHLLISDGPVKEPVPGVAWTLSHEFSGSILVYLLSLALLSMSEAKSRMLVLIAVFCYTSFIHSWMNHFTLGLMFAELDVQNKLFSINSHRFGTALKFGLAIVTLLLFCESPISFGKQILAAMTSLQYKENGQLGAQTIYWMENMAVLVQAAVALYLIETTALLQLIFSHKIFVYLGRISFMLYLTHIILVHRLFQPLEPFLHLDSIPLKFLYTIVASAISMVVAEILTLWIDEPSVWFSSWIVKKVLNSPWTVSEVISSIPFWPIGMSLFFTNRSKATYNSFTSFQWNPFPPKDIIRTENLQDGDSLPIDTALLPVDVYGKEQ